MPECKTYKIEKKKKDVIVDIKIKAPKKPKKLIVSIVELSEGSIPTVSLQEYEKEKEIIFGIPKAKDGKDAVDGKDGRDGKDAECECDLTDINTHIATLYQQIQDIDVGSGEVDLSDWYRQISDLQELINNIQLTPGKDGKDGKDAVDGKDGRDGKDAECPPCECDLTDINEHIATLYEQINNLDNEEVDLSDLYRQISDLQELINNIQLTPGKDGKDGKDAECPPCECDLTDINTHIATLYQQIQNIGAGSGEVDLSDVYRQINELQELINNIQLTPGKDGKDGKDAECPPCECDLMDINEHIATLYQQINNFDNEEVDLSDIYRQINELQELINNIQLTPGKDGKDGKDAVCPPCECDLTDINTHIATLYEQINNLDNEEVDLSDIYRQINELQELINNIQLTPGKDGRDGKDAECPPCECDLTDINTHIATLYQQIQNIDVGSGEVDLSDVYRQISELQELISNIQLTPGKDGRDGKDGKDAECPPCECDLTDINTHIATLYEQINNFDNEEVDLSDVYRQISKLQELIRNIQLTPGKDGKDAVDGKDGRDGKDAECPPCECECDLMDINEHIATLYEQINNLDNGEVDLSDLYRQISELQELISNIQLTPGKDGKDGKDAECPPCECDLTDINTHIATLYQQIQNIDVGGGEVDLSDVYRQISELQTLISNIQLTPGKDGKDGIDGKDAECHPCECECDLTDINEHIATLYEQIQDIDVGKGNDVDLSEVYKQIDDLKTLIYNISTIECNCDTNGIEERMQEQSNRIIQLENFMNNFLEEPCAYLSDCCPDCPDIETGGGLPEPILGGSVVIDVCNFRAEGAYSSWNSADNQARADALTIKEYYRAFFEPCPIPLELQQILDGMEADINAGIADPNHKKLPNSIEYWANIWTKYSYLFHSKWIDALREYRNNLPCWTE